jgi:iron(III) transport system permease protein
MDFLILVCNSLAISAVASLLVVGFAILMVFTARIYPVLAMRLLGRVATLGYSVPGAVIAIGVMLPIAWVDSIIDEISTAWLGISTGLLLSNSLVTLHYAYLVRFMAVGYRAVEAGFEGLSVHVEEAARSVGAGPWRTLIKIDVPLISTALIGAGMLVFIDVLKELPLTLILRPFNFETLATRAFELASDEEIAASANASLIIVAIGAVPALVLNRIMGREEA